MPHFEEQARPRGIGVSPTFSPGQSSPSADRSAPIPVRSPQTPGERRGTLSIVPDKISLKGYEVNPENVLKIIFGKKVDVDERTGTIRMVSAGTA